MELAAFAALFQLFCDQVGFDVKTLATSASVAIGFASQDVLKNLAAGLVIMATRPFEVRDKITCDGKTGVVSEVGFFSTRLKTSDETGLSLPNAKVASGVLVNHTSSYSSSSTANRLHRIRIPFHLPVHADLELACKVLGEVAKEMDDFVKQHNVSDFKHGQSVSEYHAHRFPGEDLQQEQERHPSKPYVNGQNIAAGFDIELRCFSDEVLVSKVYMEGFRRAVKAFKVAGVELFSPPQCSDK